MALNIQPHPKNNDLLLIESPLFGDHRGWFMETYREEWQEQLAEYHQEDWVQDNVSYSQKGTLRGLHYQINQAQAKWVRVLRGQILDVVVDLRTHSPHFGQAVSVALNDHDGRSLIIPKGFAHGFSVLSEDALFSYKCSDYYNKEAERGIHWNDPNLAINWKVEAPLISDKDNLLPFLKDLSPNDLFHRV
jgi:dTDP-4-dehydrorhamnose 3,5-epimerase